MSKFLPVLSSGLVMTAIVFAPLSATVAQQGDEGQIELPTDPDAWMNSPPISNAVLKGKAAILYFFEEG